MKDQEKKLDYLKDEYLFLQKTYEDFDQRALLIKGWSVTASIAGIGFGFQYGKPGLWLVSFFSGLLFWIIEATWKHFQYCFVDRILAIEENFRLENPTIEPFQIYTNWLVAFHKKSLLYSVFKIATMPLVFLPHAAAVTLAGGLLIVHYFFVHLVQV